KFNNIQGFSFGHIHDGYVNRDTAFLDAGDAGMCVADFSIPSQPKLLGSLTNYPGKGYNHSGWRSEDGRYYFMADENHGSPVKTVDVQDFEDMQVVDSYNAASSPTQIPHNPLVACNYLYVAYYYDGLQVYDISDPLNVERVLYYDTSTEPDGPSYKGAWGVNPFLPSGNILIADMQNGLFVFKGVGDNCVAGTSSSSGEQQSEAAGLDVSPVPSSGYLKVSIGSDPAETQHGVITISDLKGTVMHTQTFESNEFDVQIPGIVPPGCYILRAKTTAGTMVRKIIFSI
ncbi:MAG: choice-of-anchor B family protein, partial [Bacteroidota bacterium]